MTTQPWEFGVKAAPARDWSEGMGALISVAMFLGGIAGGTYLVSLYFNNLWGMLVGWVLALGMGLFDMAHLSKPTRAWRIAFRAGSSWISRGFIFVILFIGAAGIQLLISLLTKDTTAAEMFFRVVAGIFAFGVAVYSGFVVGYVNGIKFWNSAIMPFMVVLGGLAGGAAILLASANYVHISADAFATYQTVARAALAAYAIAIFVHLWVSTYTSPEAKSSALLLLKGNLAGLFWLLIILVGIAVPLVLEFVSKADASALLIVNALLVLAGNLTLRYSVIKAGRYVPLLSGE